MDEVAKARAEIERLWDLPTGYKSGPKAKKSAREVARSAVALADRDGLAALTMRSVAVEVGVSPMGLYRYFPGRLELLELMIDEVYKDIHPEYDDDLDWRNRLLVIAEENWRLIMRHPWLAEVEGHRPVLGPNVIAKYDSELRALDGLGLPDVQMDLILSTLLCFVRGAARDRLDAESASKRTGLSDEGWWRARSELLANVLQDRHPLAQRVGAVAGAENNAPSDPNRVFRFGVERLLDGLAAQINENSRQTGAEKPTPFSD